MTQQSSPDPGPEPFAAGTFALFAREDGAVVLVVRTGPDDEWRETIPAELVTLAQEIRGGGMSAWRKLQTARRARKALG
jgi:hypothetical protein